MHVEWLLTQIETEAEPDRRPRSAVEGTWRSRLGSTMELTVDGDHRVSGTFRAGVGVLDTEAEFHVAGFVEGDAVAFCVDFGRAGSVCSWSGHHLSDDDGERLITLWHLAQPVRSPHDESDTWSAIAAGSDEFTRVS